MPGSEPAPAAITAVTRLVVPRRRPDILRRPRLLDILHQNVGQRATVLAAPAGYGKTTLLVDWAHEVDMPVCWLTLDRSEADAGTLAEAIIASIQQQQPGFGLAILPEARRSRPPEELRAWIVPALVNEIHQSVGEYLALVLDDFQTVEPSQAAVALVNDLLTWAPENLHVVVISRTRPAIPCLPRLIARREALVLGPADLAFTIGEVQELLLALRGEKLSADEARELREATEGWCAALLLARPATGAKQARAAPAASPELFDFLAAEAIGDLSPEVARFLTHTSVLPELSPPLCDSLLGGEGSERLLADLERKVLFVTRVGGDGGWYRCHPLFRTFLQSKLKAEDQALFRRLGLRAASLLEGEGRSQEGLDLLLQLEAWPEAADAIARAAPSLAGQGKWRALAGLLEALPPRIVGERPDLALWQAKASFHTEDPDGALRLAAQALAALEASGDQASATDALLTSGEVLRYKGDIEGALERFQEALRRVGGGGPNERLRAEVLRQLGTSHGMTGDLSAAVPELEEAKRLYEAAGDLGRVASVSDSLGRCYASQSRWEEADGALERARVAWEHLDNLGDLALTLNNLGVLHYERGSYRASMEMYEQALKAARKASHLRAEAYAAAGMADTLRALAHYDRAMELYRQSIELARRIGDDSLLRAATQGLGLAYLYTGDAEQAQFLLREATAAHEEEGPFNRGLDRLVEGQWLVETGRPAEALTPLGEAAQLFAGCEARREGCLALFLLARASFDLRKRRDALQLLERAATLAGELGYERFLEPEAWRAQALVQYGASRNIGQGLYRRLLQAPTARPAPAAAERPAPPPGALPPVRAYALGEARVVVGERPVTDFEWRSEKSREMFFYFLLNPRPLRRDDITADLWPDLPESKCNSNFHSNLHRLRRAVYLQCVRTEGSRYALNPQGTFWLDADEFAAKLSEVDRLPAASDERDSALEEALALYRGPLLPEVYSEWCEPIRQRLEDGYLRALSGLAALRFERGEHGEVLDLCDRILVTDPYHEEAVFWTMQSHVALGDRTAALRAYRRYRETLESQLGTAPPPRIVHLYERLLASQPPE